MEDSTVEKNAPWGLARISHRDSLSFGTFNKYLYATNGGEGVDVYAAHIFNTLISKAGPSGDRPSRLEMKTWMAMDMEPTVPVPSLGRSTVWRRKQMFMP